MLKKETAVRELWARQQISPLDVDYNFWARRREDIRQLSRLTSGCIFTVDVYKGIYDFASDHFSRIFGYDPAWIETIGLQGDLLEDRIHPDDREQLIDFQLEHGQFIYSLPSGQRNDYQQVFQYRVRNSKREYIHVISRQQVVQQDKNNKAWMIMGIMDIAPDQVYSGRVKRTVIHRKTGEIVPFCKPLQTDISLTPREKEILILAARGLLSKEIADKLNLSIHTVNNHRKNMLSRLKVDHIIEAINMARISGILD